MIINLVGFYGINYREIPQTNRDLPLQGGKPRNIFAPDKNTTGVRMNNLKKASIMKKLMIIAVIISGMLMPAQGFAKNDRNDRRANNSVQVDHNRGKKSNDVVKHVNKSNHKAAPVVKHNPAPAAHHKHVAVHHKPAVVHHHCNPAPVVVSHHCPPPAPVVHHHCGSNGVAQAAAVAIGIAGLVSILAN